MTNPNGHKAGQGTDRLKQTLARLLMPAKRTRPHIPLNNEDNRVVLDAIDEVRDQLGSQNRLLLLTIISLVAEVVYGLVK